MIWPQPVRGSKHRGDATHPSENRNSTEHTFSKRALVRPVPQQLGVKSSTPSSILNSPGSLGPYQVRLQVRLQDGESARRMPLGGRHHVNPKDAAVMHGVDLM
ncbi:hypothetical protein BDW72DRAFT_172422 [Aspergillus terricola var. indicus]